MNDWQDLEQTLTELLRCPKCGGPFEYRAVEDWLICRECRAEYKREDGIWRMLTEEQRQRYRPFLESYRPLRQAEGWERDRRDYYLNLPNVPPADPQAAIWRIRRRSLARLERIIGPGNERWVLDLGAGNGWLSRRLVKFGFRVVALDLNAVGSDSLEGGRLYQEQDGKWFGRVQASMEELPFRAGAFDLCVASGTLHYAALEPTLQAVWRVLAVEGRFIITDSPVYSQAAAGEAMSAEYLDRARTRFGREAHWPGGPGFLSESELWASLRGQGFEVARYSVERWAGRVRRQLWRWLTPPRREEARFPVIVARKPPI